MAIQTVKDKELGNRSVMEPRPDCIVLGRLVHQGMDGVVVVVVLGVEDVEHVTRLRGHGVSESFL